MRRNDGAGEAGGQGRGSEVSEPKIEIEEINA